jgi:ornithine carbamoyltransferase
MEKDLISILDLSPEEIEKILETARNIKEKQKKGELYQPLKGKTLGLIFQKQSTRTRISFEVGMFQLGGRTVSPNLNELQLSRGETVGDTAKVLSRYLNGVVIRGEHKFLLDFAKNASIPVINGLTEKTHPCQILSDLFTIREHGKTLKNLKLVFVGDGNNICNSLMLASGKMGINFVASCPGGYEPDKEIMGKAKDDASKSGATIELISEPCEAVKKADVLYTDTWISMGQEEEENKRLLAFKPYQINGTLLKAAKNDCIVMHCLPAHRGQEITSEVLDGRNSIVWDQAENRLHAQKAVLAMWLSK